MKINIFFITMLMISIFLSVIGETAHGEEDVDINVIINNGLKYKNANDKRIEWAVKNYTWWIGNKEYKINTYRLNYSHLRWDYWGLGTKNYFDPDYYQVHIIDGGVDEHAIATRPLIGALVRKKFEQYISDGGGYIGNCGGAFFAPYFNGFPNTVYECDMIERSGFLKDMPEVKAHAIFGLPIVSHIRMIKPGIVGKYRTTIRAPQDPLAIGGFQYNSNENVFSHQYNQRPYNFHGVCVDLEQLKKDHPILKDYWGNTLYMNHQGGGFYEVPDNVNVLAYFPQKLHHNNPDQDICGWKFTPKIGMIIDWCKLKQLIISGITGLISVDDLPIEWQSQFNNKDEVYFGDLVNWRSSDWECWTKTNKIIKSDINGRPAIIAFDYKTGKVLLSGPHTINKIWDNAYTKYNSESDITRSKGFYRWYDKDDNEPLTFKDDLVLNTPMYPLYRRQIAWAAKNVIDEHMPPINTRSYVLDIDPNYQESTEIDIICCVGREHNESWITTNLTLHYKYNDNGVWTDWFAYESLINASCYKFTFDAESTNGSGQYRFCSNLSTYNTSGWNNDTLSEDENDYDAEVYINTDILAIFLDDVQYAYANQPINFNGTMSKTITGTNITNYQWDFGDGGTSNQSKPIHTYTDDGEYTVSLNVTNNASAFSVTTKTITIHNNPPIVNSEPFFEIVFTNENMNLTDNSTDSDGNITNWHWDFGDNTNSTTQNTTHTYNTSGYYGVKLIITDDDNDTETRNGGILVIDKLVNTTKTPTNQIWNNLQEAIDNSTKNEYIYIENGTYNENIIINKTINIKGEGKDTVSITGSLQLNNPYDYELPDNKTVDIEIYANMTGNILLMHLNNDTAVGENYSSSNIVFDHSGEYNNGSNNGANWTTNTIKGRGALSFNGINNSVNLSNITDLTGENITISAWIKWDGGTGTMDPVLSQSNTTHGYCLYINNTSSKPVFRLDTSEAVSSQTINCNGWHFIVGTHDENILKIYVNGLLTGSANKTGTGFDTDCYIGYDNVSSYFYGKIDEVAVWNRTMSYDEISRLYSSNNGICVEGISFKDVETGLNVCEYSEISFCNFVNNTVGILIDDVRNVFIDSCNISDQNIGIKVNNSNPEYYYSNMIVDCYIDNVTSGIIVSNSSHLSIIRSTINGSSYNLSFSNCDYDNISVIYSNTPFNVAPEQPTIIGPSMGMINVSYNFSTNTFDKNNDQMVYKFDWGDGNNTGWLWLYDNYETVNASHTWMDDGNYDVTVTVRDVFDNETTNISVFIIDILPPVVESVNSNPNTCGYGGNVSITVETYDNIIGGYSGVNTVKINISSPENTIIGNYTMDYKGNDTFDYIFNNTWIKGQYNYSIWISDNAGNNITSSGYHFNVSNFANITVCTIKDEYGDNEYVNLTDPPGSSYLTGCELLDDNKVLHIWNKFDSYYFNTSNGIQLTNHKDEYWSTNVLMLGYYNNDIWNLIYRADNLSGFYKNIKTDNETFVNATLWKDLSYGGYDFRLAIRYYLGVDDNELTVIPYIKNLDDENITYNLGFAWELKDIQVDMTPEDDYIEIDGTSYYLNQTLDETYTNLSQSCYYIKEDKTGNSYESLYLKWDENLNYKVKVESREGQYNAPVTLGIKIGTLNVGQEKYTEIFWHDASEITYYFDDYDDRGEVWTSNPSYMTDGSTSNYASTQLGGDIELCDNNTCIGDDLGTISKVEIRAHGYSTIGQRDIYLRPVFSGTTDGSDNTFDTESSASWSRWYDITNDGIRPSYPAAWTWTEIRDLDCDVEAENIFGFWSAYCSKVEVRVTYNNLPGISSPYPIDGATGIILTPTLNITVSDPDGDNMNIQWLSNSSGSWQSFGTNSSVGNGTYHQTFSNASENGKWWFWKVNVSDDDGYNISSVFKFYTGCQSKIVNTGSTDINGFLLIQVHYYNTTSETWTLADDTINETTVRTINGSSEGGTGPGDDENVLGLDIIFNGLVNTNDLLDSFGSGTYRVYAAFRDPDGDVLVCDDESLLETSYEFSITSS